MYLPIKELEAELEVVFRKLMHLSSPGTVSETVQERHERRIACLNATARIMQGRLTDTQ